MMNVMFEFWLWLVKLKLVMVNIELIEEFFFFSRYLCIEFIIIWVCLVLEFGGVCIWVNSMFWFLLGRNVVGMWVNI